MAGNATTVYRAKKAASLANPTAAAAFVQSDNSALAASVYFNPIPSSGTGLAVATLRFRVRAWGRATSGATSNFKATLQYGNSITAGSNTDLVALTNRSYATASGDWFIDLDGIWDATLGKICGNGGGFNLSTAETVAAITNQTADLTQQSIGFSVSALFGTSNASNVCYLDAFTMEVL